MRRLRIGIKFIICLISLCLATLGGHAEKPTIIPLRVQAGTSKRIVSLAPSITESLYQLGADEALIAVTSYCNYPPQAKTKEIIGTIIGPNIEKIYSLSPDLVLANNGINRSQTIEKLKSLGLRVVALDECDNFGDIIKSFIQLGKLIDREQEVKAIIKKVEAEVKSINQRLKTLPRVRVFWEVGARPLVSVGPQSFTNEFTRYSGGINIFNDTPGKHPRVSREEVLKRNPDVIMLVTMGDVTEREKEYWKKFKDLKAAKFDRIYIIDADKVCRPTPNSFLAGLKEVAALLHPEVFGGKPANRQTGNNLE